MKAKFICFFTALVIAIGGFFSFLFLFRQSENTSADISAMNDIAMTVFENKGVVPENLPDYDFTYSIVNEIGNVIYSTSENAPQSANEALKNGDIIYSIEKDGMHFGKLLVCRDRAAEEAQKQSAALCIAGTIFLTAVTCVFYFLYLRKEVFVPFRRMESFARSVAMGKLDLPAEMDRNNVFGAFTESFDIMREELKASREREMQAEKSKRELVAQLSHDIKTPVASIKAIAEVMAARAEKDGNEYEIKQLSAVTAKADQINQLITNIFHAALEELDKLPVNVCEIDSKAVAGIISDSDYNGRAESFSIPDCIITCDPLRLRQIFDNIISNSYKYADTKINVMSEIEDDFLSITISDYGSGVTDADRARLFTKYYRGVNSDGKNGSGLGLYISRYLVERMGGTIESVPSDTGFVIKIRLALA